ncbi:hypothetical protein Q1695_001198 [Nippostrongylus brasiliensis]|nr:hypothetical protein Q1695_001198 [Nippostrongylus brasiliensis]
MTILLKLCRANVRSVNETSPRGVFLSTSIIIAFNLDYLTKVDRIYRVQCFYMEMERQIEKEVLVKMPPPTLHTKQVPMPVCKYEVLDGTPHGNPVYFATVGQMVYHKWTCEAEQTNTFCMVVHSCFVDDGNGERVQLINEKGCALDKYLLTNLEYPEDLMAGREAHVYKYADRDNMYFDCQITLRIKEPGSEYCEVPTCPDPPRRRRSHPLLSAVTPVKESKSADDQSNFIIPHDDIVKLNWIQMNFDVRQAVLCMSNIGLSTVFPEIRLSRTIQSMAAWVVLMLFPPMTLAVLVVVIVATFGGTLGVREMFVEGLTRIFEWGSKTSHGYEYLETEVEPSSTESAPRLKKRHSSGDLGIIHREKSELIDSKLHSTDAPPCRQTTVSVVVDDSIDFITAGIEAIIEDQVTSRFRAEQLPSWNLLTRTRYSFQYINWRLSLLWAAGFLFRYLFLVPIRIFLFMLGLSTMCGVCYIVGHIPNPKVKKFLNRHVMLMSMRIFSRSFSSIIRFHDQENRAKKGGICVANHTSPIDVMVLSCDNCYAMIGQKQGGLLGFIQDSLSRSEHHIWFERSEAADRKKVTQRLKEHVEDENKLPIIIFPEGTCINNTSVMMFKKGSFEIGSTIYPIAMKYDSRLTDAFWNSSEQSYGEYLWRMMTSWAIICDVWYLPPMTKEPGEDAIAFARRVKRAIAKKGGLVDLEWDGALKRERVSSKLIQLQQKLYYDRLTRTTTINNLTEEDMQTDVLDIMQVSAYGHELRKVSDSMGAVLEPEVKNA